MIFETESDGRKFKHLKFIEICEDDPLAVLALVEKLFAEIALMPNGQTWFMRIYPEIERMQEFSGPKMAQVRCRFSTEEILGDPEPMLCGLGKQP